MGLKSECNAWDLPSRTAIPRRKWSLVIADRNESRGAGTVPLLDEYSSHNLVPARFFGSHERSEFFRCLPCRQHTMAPKLSFHFQVGERPNDRPIEFDNDSRRCLRGRQ